MDNCILVGLSLKMRLENYSNFGLKLGQDLKNRWNLPAHQQKLRAVPPPLPTDFSLHVPREIQTWRLQTPILNNSIALIQELINTLSLRWALNS